MSNISDTRIVYTERSTNKNAAHFEDTHTRTYLEKAPDEHYSGCYSTLRSFHGGREGGYIRIYCYLLIQPVQQTV